MVKSITNEFLEMTYPDQYYKDVIEPAKTGKGPMPSKMQMLSKSQPFKALSLPFREMMNPGSYGAFRSSGTPMASRALGLGRTALGGPFGLAALTGQGLGMAADKYAQATNTPEAYEYMKSMGGVNSLGNFDETNLDVGDIYSEIDRLNQPQTSQPMGTDVIGMDEMNTYGQVPMGTDVIGMDEMNTYDNRDFTNVGGLGIANEPDVEQGEYSETPSKFQNFKKGIMDNPLTRGAGTAFNFLRGSVPGMLMSGLGALFNRDGADYQQYTPDFDYKGLNDSMINDFYDPATGLNRFDRARKKGNTFGSARTGAEYFKLRREKKAANAAAEAKRQSDLRTVQQRAARGDSLSQIGKDMYTGSGQAFEKQKSGTFTTPSGKRGYSGGRRDGGRVGYGNGGLATLFTRRG